MLRASYLGENSITAVRNRGYTSDKRFNTTRYTAFREAVIHWLTDQISIKVGAVSSGPLRRNVPAIVRTLRNTDFETETSTVATGEISNA